MSKLTHLPDVQNRLDQRNIPLKKAGIKDLLHPILFLDPKAEPQHCLAKFNMSVGLPAHQKGTHMSRFIEILHQHQPLKISLKSLPALLDNTLTQLNAESAYIDLEFTYLMNKVAPVSHQASYLDYGLKLSASIASEQLSIVLQLSVPIATLCPCSKEISDYGAHNQRSLVTIRIPATPDLSVAELIPTIEAQGSCELFGIIKRADEKAVTERAFENPKFAEDVVRDVALALNKMGIGRYKINTENLESIHNHSAFAEIDHW